MAHPIPASPLDLNPNPDREDLEDHIHETIEYLETLRNHLTRYLPHFFGGSATFNPANLADGAGETTTVTVTGAALGDLAFASFSLDVQGITVTAYVSAANTVAVRFQNETGGAVNLAEGTLRAFTVRPVTS